MTNKNVFNYAGVSLPHPSPRQRVCKKLAKIIARTGFASRLPQGRISGRLNTEAQLEGEGQFDFPSNYFCFSKIWKLRICFLQNIQKKGSTASPPTSRNIVSCAHIFPLGDSMLVRRRDKEPGQRLLLRYLPVMGLFIHRTFNESILKLGLYCFQSKNRS